MAFGGFDNKGSGGHAMSEINMVPLIDVMLVLLVIFIITAPLLAHSIRINMPQVSAEPVKEEPKAVDLAIDADGQLFWDDKPVPQAELADRFAAAAAIQPQPELRIRADLNTRYETLAKVMAGARRAGLGKIGFVTTPNLTDADASVPAAGAETVPARGGTSVSATPATRAAPAPTK